jgi:hypothetical protein
MHDIFVEDMSVCDAKLCSLKDFGYILCSYNYAEAATGKGSLFSLTIVKVGFWIEMGVEGSCFRNRPDLRNVR